MNKKNDICDVLGAGTMICVYLFGSVICRILSCLVVWAVTAVCFVIGLIGVIIPAFVNGVIRICESSVYYISITFAWLSTLIENTRPKLKAQVTYLVDLRNDVLHDCGRGDMYGYEDEF